MADSCRSGNEASIGQSLVQLALSPEERHAVQSANSYVPSIDNLYSTFLTLVSVNQFDDGYANLATLTNSDEDFAIYRRFGYLQARLLLEKQDQLRLLEEQLDVYDDVDPVRHTRKGLSCEQHSSRQKLLGEIEAVFTSYGSCISIPTLPMF